MTQKLINECLGQKQNVFHFRCNNCQVPICEEKGTKSPTHLIECDTLARVNQMGTSGDKKQFEDYNIITPLRLLLMKQKHPKNYEKLSSLVSNIESKVVNYHFCLKYVRMTNSNRNWVIIIYSIHILKL